MGEAALKIEQEAERVPIGELIRKELERARDDRDAVRVKMRARAVNDPVFWDAYRIEACEALVDRELSRIMADDRRKSVHISEMPPIPQNGYGSMRNSARATAHFMAYRLSTGKKMRDALPDEVEKDARRQLALSNTHGQRGRWQILVARAAPDKKTPIGKQLDEGKLESLWRKAA